MDAKTLEVRQFFRDFDAEWSRCPVEKRQRELREEERVRKEKERETRRQREEEQDAAARKSADWYAWVDERINEHFRQRFDRDADGNVGPITAAIGDALGHTRADIREEFTGVIDKLRDEFRIGMGRVPIAKSWDDTVCHVGDVVSYGGETFQCLEDTGKTPAADHPHWRLLACRGRDAISPRVLGQFDAQRAYGELSIVEHHGCSYIAIRDLAPGNIPGHDDEGWQLIARHGHRGPVGETGPQGPRGTRGPRGADAPVVVAWTLDHKNYTAIPTMSDGRAGAPLELRGLFELFLMQTQGWS